MASTNQNNINTKTHLIHNSNWTGLKELFPPVTLQEMLRTYRHESIKSCRQETGRLLNASKRRTRGGLEAVRFLVSVLVGLRTFYKKLSES